MTQSRFEANEASQLVFYWKMKKERILIAQNDNNIIGIVFVEEKVYSIPFNQVRGFDIRALSSEATFRAFFKNTWLKVNYDTHQQPCSIDVNARLLGGTLGSFLVSSAMVAGGIVLTVSTGGTILPILIGSALTGAGVSGGIHSVLKPEAGINQEFIKECAIGAATNLVTSGAGMCVKGAAQKIGEQVAKQTLKQITISAAKETAEEIAIRAVADLAKVGIITTVEEIQQQAIKEIGKKVSQNVATKVIAGAVGGAVGKVSNNTLRKDELPSAAELTGNMLSGSLSGALSAAIGAATTEPPATENTASSMRQILKKIGVNTLKGAGTSAASSVALQLMDNTIKGVPFDHELNDAALGGAAIGAASAFINSVTTPLVDADSNNEPMCEKLKAKSARLFFNDVEALAKIKDYEGYFKTFETHQHFNDYLKNTLKTFAENHAGSLTKEELIYIKGIKNRLLNGFLNTPQEIESCSEKMLGHFQNKRGYSALFSGVNTPKTTRIIVESKGDVFVNEVRVPTVNLEGMHPTLAFDFQTLFMVEAYNQAPASMKSALLMETRTSIIRSALNRESLNYRDRNFAKIVIEHLKNNINAISVPTGYMGDEFDMGAHTFQVSFFRVGSLIYPLIDNYGSGAQRHPEFSFVHGSAAPVQLEPFDIITEEQALYNYLRGLSRAIWKPSSKALSLIYDSRPYLSNPKEYPQVALQPVGNCAVYNLLPETKRMLVEVAGAYTHFMSTATQFLTAARDSARNFSSIPAMSLK